MLDSQSAESCSVVSPVLCRLIVDPRKLLVRWTLSLQRVVQSAALYCAARLLIHGNYWYTGLSPRIVVIKGPVRAKNPRTVLYRQTLQRTVLYLWSISEVWYQSAGLFESSVRYTSIAKYMPNEVPLGDFNFKMGHLNIDIMNSDPSAEILKGFFLSIKPKKAYLNLMRLSL